MKIVYITLFRNLFSNFSILNKKYLTEPRPESFFIINGLFLRRNINYISLNMLPPSQLPIHNSGLFMRNILLLF